jgi:hypothetical protein
MTDHIKVYIYGCACGSIGTLLRALKREHGQVNVLNSKFDLEARKQHVEYLKELKIKTDGYPAVVFDGSPRLL